MSKGYILAQITAIDVESYSTSGYMKMAEDCVAAFGGRFMVRGGNPEVLEGNTGVQRTVILEFPSRADAKRFYDSEMYAPAIALRQSFSTGCLTLLEEYVA